MLHDSNNSDRSPETLEYLHAMLAQLGMMARRERFEMLGYLIDMARLEAADTMRGEQESRVLREQRDRASGVPL